MAAYQEPSYIERRSAAAHLSQAIAASHDRQLSEEQSNNDRLYTSIPQMDGAMESNQHLRLGGDQVAIFVHAGAGVHSFEHEKDHLAACANAQFNQGNDWMLAKWEYEQWKTIILVEVGQLVLSKVRKLMCSWPEQDLLTMSGVKNPIHAAREVLEQTKQRLSFGRVPANLLTGDGALKFAEDHGICTCHPICLVAPAAGRKHSEWKSQVDKAEEEEEDEEDEASSIAVDSVQDNIDPEYSASDNISLWNEGQPQTPRIPGSEFGDATIPPIPRVKKRSPSQTKGALKRPQQYDIDQIESVNGIPIDRIKANDQSEQFFEAAFGWNDDTDLNGLYSFGMTRSNPSLPPSLSRLTGTNEADHHALMSNKNLDFVASDLASAPTSELYSRNYDATQKVPKEDIITDTVGVIAVDSFGNIAAASSSGGTGLKHKGRVGPAALINIGTAVIPADTDDDEDLVSVACVTSGTGEHIATTMAAGLCAERVYTSTRRGKGGRLDPTDEETALRAWIEKEFSHPTKGPKSKKKIEALKALKKRRVLRQRRDFPMKQISPKMKAGDMEVDLNEKEALRNDNFVPEALEQQFDQDEDKAVK
ncbi:uncharacterized protein KY384_007872 [Bacidia gigantensis]|uniref:uncharacterized protein n=1 Tax=Bacidia gigantensis TaxID=2732470 RepID=UPI001D0464C1|nr:uncharacterized protein KY384_007872 [Bacidia gigantensis]KAG8527718.1 hypothetical protein KY384_007872 [Bacidia gigantensis]